MDGKFKVGNVLKSNHNGLIIEVIDKREDNYENFSAKVLNGSKDALYEDDLVIGDVRNTFHKDNSNWAILHGYDTPLYKVLNHGD